jgi:hypothetical protein
MSISKNFVNLSERVRPFYVVDLHPTETKGLCKSNWCNEHILDFKDRKEEKRFLFLDSLDEVFFLSKNDPKFFGISSVFEICSLRKGTREKSECTSLDDFRIGTFCIDIDDQRLNPKSQYYDEEFDYSKNRLQGSELFCNALFDELSNTPFVYGYKSNKGYHIVMRLTDDYIPLLGCQNVPFTNQRILEKYPKLKDIMKYLQIDILQQHNIKKPNEDLKGLWEVKSEFYRFNVAKGIGFEKLSKISFKLSDPPKDKKQTFTTISQYERFNCSISKTMRVLNLLGLRIARKSGSEIFVSCPFHAEKTPSLAVNLDTGKWHCFGCGKGGGLPLLYKLIRGCQWKNAYLDLKSL